MFWYVHFITRIYSYFNFKPIFHCNAKPLAFGPRIGLDHKCNNFALPKPTCWYPTKCQRESFRNQHEALQTQRQALQTQREAWWTQHEPVEYYSHWVCKGWLNVVYMVFSDLLPSGSRSFFRW